MVEYSNVKKKPGTQQNQLKPKVAKVADDVQKHLDKNQYRKLKDTLARHVS